MKIALYSPYLDTVGGGERYILSIAAAVDEGVDVLLDANLASKDIDTLKKKIEKILGLNLSNINFVEAPLGRENVFDKALFLKKYDCLFYLTDGSFFLSTAKKNIIHYQVPFERSYSLVDRIKLLSWNQAIYNSLFTKRIVEKNLPLRGQVVYPPVDTQKFKSLEKKNQIISVGRFFGYLKTKKQELLIDSFKKIDPKNWTLVLVGSAAEGDEKYLEQLKKKARGVRIEFYPNASFETLQKLYGESKIYWHATGFGEDDPKKFEHFGISTVEAMASGVVPVVIDKGGQKEIVESGKSGYLWQSLDKLEENTIKLINDSKLLEQMGKEAIKKSRDFDQEIFIEKIRKIIYG